MPLFRAVAKFCSSNRLFTFSINETFSMVQQQEIDMRVTTAAVVTTKSLFGMCDYKVDSDVGMGELSLMLEILHVYGHLHV